MATYSAITAGQIDADSPVDVPLAAQWSNNVLAMFEGDATASGVRLQPAALKTGMIYEELLETLTPTGSSPVTFTTNMSSTYDEYVVRFLGVRANTGTLEILSAQISNDNGSTFKTSGYQYATMEHDSFTGDVSVKATSAANIHVCQIAASGTYLTNGEVVIKDHTNSATKSVIKTSAETTVSNAYVGVAHGSGLYSTATSIITNIRFATSITTLHGTFKLYGRNTV